MATRNDSRGKLTVNSPVYQAHRTSERARDRARYHAGEKVTRKARYERQKAETDRWEWRARRLRNSCSNKAITGGWLKSLWGQQQGLCGLTGRSLNFDDMELDHIIPRARGGTDDFDNFRLVCSVANWAKSDLLDSELADLCRDILKEIANGQ